RRDLHEPCGSNSHHSQSDPARGSEAQLPDPEASLMSDRRKIVGLACVTLLAACALKDPPPQTELQTEGLPGVELPGAWQAGGAPGSVQTAWLATFDAPQLNAFVSEALEQNTDFRGATPPAKQAPTVLHAPRAACF